MADATKLPALADIAFYQFSRKGSPAPKLAAPLNAYTDTTVQLTVPLRDENSAIVTRAFLLGIKKANGWVETVYCAGGANVSADGLTLTVVRGIDPGGLDYTSGSAAFAESHNQDEAVFCNIPAAIMALLVSALQGTIANGSTGFTIGNDAAGTVTIYRSTGTGTKTGMFRWNTGNGKAEYSNGGVTWNSIDSATASNLLVVTNSDTTPSNLNAKTSSGTGITRTVLNPGANETLEFSLNLTATPTEINQAIHGISANVTAANLNTLTGGGNADVLHTHVNAPDREYYPLESIIGEAVSASDITNNLNLMYQSPTDGKWYKVTSSTATWYYNLGILLDSAALNDTNKRILKYGRYTGKNFANIAPTFTSALTGTDNIVGNAAASAARAFLIDNSSGAECVVTGGTISAKQNGTPAQAMRVELYLEQQDITNTPACFIDTTNNRPRGALLASATIAQATFSGTYAAMPFSWGAKKIPAGCRAYVVVTSGSASDAANYYIVQSNAATMAYSTTSNAAWSGTVNAGNITLTVTSTSPVGYSVKAYAGSNGSFGLTPTNPWARCIGIVLSGTEMLFAPTRGLISRNGTHGGFAAVPITANGFGTITTNFCPTEIDVLVGASNVATVTWLFSTMAYIRGDNVSSFRPQANGESSGVDNLMGGGSGNAFELKNLYVNGVGVANSAPIATQNHLYIVRLETGYHVYIGYPTGTNFMTAGAAGCSSWQYTVSCLSRA